MRPEDISRGYTPGSIVVRRWAATWLDLVLFAVLFVLLVSLLWDKHPALATGVFLVLLLLYYPLLEGLTGMTFGKMVCRIKVVDEFGHTPGILKATIRTLVRLIEVNPLLMGGVPAGIAVMASDTRQRLGDLAARTFVLKVEDLFLLTMPAPPPAYAAYPAASPALPAHGDFDIGVPLSTVPAQALPAYGGPVTRRPPAKPRPWALPAACVATLVTVGLIWGGVRGFASAERTGKPVTISCAQFLQSPPKEGWFHLTGCGLSVVDAAYEELRFGSSASGSDSFSSSITDVYIPVYAAGDEERKKTSLVLATRDEKIRSLVDKMRSLEGQSEEQIKKWILAHLQELEIERDITGTLEPEYAVAESTRSEIVKQAEGHLTANYSVIKDGGRPVPGGPMASITGGVLCGIAALVLWMLALIHLAQQADARRRV